MKDFFDEYEHGMNANETPDSVSSTDEHFEAQDSADAQEYEVFGSDTDTSSEGSYEWNADADSSTDSEPRQFDTGSSDPAVTPTRYDSPYTAQPSYPSQQYGYQSQPAANPYGYSRQSGYSGYGQHYAAPQAPQTPPQAPKKQKAKKERKPVSRGFLAAMLSLTVLASAALGFGGGFLAKSLNSTTSGNVTINQVSSGSVTNASSVTATTTSDIVKKTADSVVEIATEGMTTGMFARQYVTKGAGSGVIISADGYIVTNHHVIDGANTITVTLRDGKTTYDATLIGSDEENDIALIKIDAEGLSPATFGDSASLAVGDYVVAIGNPLGTLGGTVTDGIISALAREVTIEDNNMTLLQTNAQISPGNSGGGLFNAAGELVGIVNAKDSATEVEGIAFAIPVNNVIDIIKDLQNYGYVTGRIDTGMGFVDITSTDTAFYYGVNELGCYVLSVNAGSNAETAGFKRGDLIVSVDGIEVDTQSEISSVLENHGKKVGDAVTFTIKRNGQTQNLQLTLAEYKPSAKLNQSTSGSDNSRQSQSGGEDLWNQIFGW